MIRRHHIFILLALILAACGQQQTTQVERLPTVQPFPTATPGVSIRGVLPTQAPQPLADSSLANPATAVALANLPSPTPDYTACPPPSTEPLNDVPPNGRAVREEIERFLSAGGPLPTLENGMRLVWRVLPDDGFIRNDVDLTNDGSVEIMMAYAVPDDGGTLLIMGCENGAYSVRYQALTGGGTPQVLQIADMNQDQLPDILFTSQLCVDEARTQCAFQTQLVTWNATIGRFVSILNAPIRSENPPTFVDVDNDRVTEVAVQLTNPGTRETGPLRTGTLIYDWNGTAYTLSITQFDAPRFRIQIVQEADRAMQIDDYETATRLYQRAADDPDLQNWLADDADVLRSYALFRLLTTYTFIEDERNIAVLQTLGETFLDPATAPVYVALSNAFWETFQSTGNINTACAEVQNIIRDRPEAIGLLNRYGSSSPSYTSRSLCPF